jgi:hypothetical protein
VDSTKEQRQAFGKALAKHLKGFGRPEFAVEVKALSGESVSDGAISQWVSGENEPTRTKVLAMEQVLELAPGTLSRHLGWVPASSRPIRSLRDAILAAEELDADGRDIMLNVLGAVLRDR